MKLCRVGEANKEKPAVIDNDGNYRDLTSIIKDLDPSTLNFETIDKLRNINVETLNIIDQKKRIGACISKPSKFIGIGLNYKDHALEQNLPIPKEPIIFSKFTNCICGPNDDIEVPKKRDANQILNEIPITYVPARNTIFLSFGLAFAETIKSNDIFIGVNALDYSGYPDCRPEYIESFEKMAQLATKSGTEKNNQITIHTPLIQLTKAEIIKTGLALGIDYGITHSCYDPVDNGNPCGACDACQIRLKGFLDAGLSDPLVYNK